MIYMNVKLIEEQESCWLACGWKRINDKNLNKLSKLRSMSLNHLPKRDKIFGITLIICKYDKNCWITNVVYHRIVQGNRVVWIISQGRYPHSFCTSGKRSHQYSCHIHTTISVDFRSIWHRVGGVSSKINANSVRSWKIKK